ncbi:putative DNA methylase 2 [Cronobacter phage CR3]|uniref:Putative DNA methylase 2 n=1 Tax=Cronobacter phage CR3 TaxID=1162295 RepID=I1TRV0_9CAUD|nr:putative DNA methylase 2 [Cronobacter phage CR3]AFH21423.1 putative DNA methylase 2 [Cronobacter phage CR3]
MKIYNEDCLSVLKTLPDNCVDMVLCDPPYGTTPQSWDSVIPFQDMWVELHRVTKDNGPIVLFGSEPFSTMLRASNIKNFKYDWIWVKNKGTGHLNAKKMPMKYHETISVFYKKPVSYYPQETDGHAPMNYARNKQNNINGRHGSVETNTGTTKRKPRSLLEFSVVNNDGSTDGGRFHPNQKPVALLKYLIETYTLPGEVVMDFTMGSGSTGVACKELNREFIGMETDQGFFNSAIERLR